MRKSCRSAWMYGMYVPSVCSSLVAGMLCSNKSGVDEARVSGVTNCLDLILSLLDTPPSMPRFIFQKFGLPLHSTACDSFVPGNRLGCHGMNCQP